LESTAGKLLQMLIEEKIILSLDELTDEKIQELINLLKHDKELLVNDNE
jgi:hypothetical protein